MRQLHSAVAIGIYSTLLFVGLMFWYYSKTESLHSADQKKNFLMFLLETAHEKSVDLRLVMRGEKQPESNIAILAIDAQALREGGRWPWSRSLLAKALTQVLNDGAQLIAFDIVFSEPSANPAEELVNKLKSTVDLPKPIEAEIDKELVPLNSDNTFRNFIKAYAPRLVLGSLYEEEASSASPDTLTSLCYTWLFDKQAAAKIWENDNSIAVHPLIFTDPDLVFPKTLQDAYSLKLTDIETQVTQSRPEARTRRDEILLQTEIEHQQRALCAHFLEKGQDPFFDALDAETWKKLQEAEVSLKPYPSFEDFAAVLKKRNLDQGVPMGWSWVTNIPDFSVPGIQTGYFNADQDSDGTIRRSRLISRAGFHYIPSLALKAYLVSQGLRADIAMARDPRTFDSTEVTSLKLIDIRAQQPAGTIPVDRDGRLMINYLGPEKMFPHVSIAHFLNDDPNLEYTQRVYDPKSKRFVVLNKRVPKKEFLKNKILFAGATATGVYDLRVTPFQANYPGVETHANVLESLISTKFLRISSSENFVMPLACAVLGIVLSIFLGHVGALPGLMTTLLLFFGIGFIDRFFLFQKGIVVVIFFPLLLTLSLYVIMTFYKYLTEERSKIALRKTFQKYVSPAIVEEVLSHPDRIELGGRKMDVTVFFSDVRGFTTISEKLDPKALSDLLNDYLTPMTDLVFKNRGTLDKYMGDAIMAFFGAPLPFSDHAKWACRCALEHIQRLENLQAEFRKRNLPEIDIGIGLNTGEVSVGNMGSQTVRNYTVMGDNVNLGSRLEGATKQYGVRTIVSHSTYERAKDAFLCREIDVVRVKGKLQPIQIYELMSEGFNDTTKSQLADAFSAGYQLYRQREFNQAVDAFRTVLAAHPDDGVTEVYIERSLYFLSNPPAADWDGVYTMTTK